MVHGGIDGCSCLITYLNCRTYNRTTTVLFQFLKATGLYGLPLRVFGGMCFYMFWNHCITMFCTLEDSTLLDRSDNVHKLSLHIVFLPQIQNCLEQFRNAWNHHSLHTGNNRISTQVWTEEMLANMGVNSTATNNVFGEHFYTADNLEDPLEQHRLVPLPTHDAEQVPSVIVEVPQISLNQQQLQSVNIVVNHISDLKMKYQACCAETANALLT